MGAQHVTYLQDSAGAADVTLTDADLAAIEDIMKSATPVGGPAPRCTRKRRADQEGA